MNNELLMPLLDRNKFTSLKSYNISRLFYVAFLGGIIPIIVLGCKNMTWLKIDRKIIVISRIVGTILLVAQICLVMLYFRGLIEITVRSIVLTFKIVDIMLYLLYYFFMKTNFMIHFTFYSQTVPLLKPAIKWSMIGVIAEFVFLIIGRSIV